MGFAKGIPIQAFRFMRSAFDQMDSLPALNHQPGVWIFDVHICVTALIGILGIQSIHCK